MFRYLLGEGILSRLDGVSCRSGRDCGLKKEEEIRTAYISGQHRGKRSCMMGDAALTL